LRKGGRERRKERQEEEGKKGRRKEETRKDGRWIGSVSARGLCGLTAEKLGRRTDPRPDLSLILCFAGSLELISGIWLVLDA
jgi:hypothetical protein